MRRGTNSVAWENSQLNPLGEDSSAGLWQGAGAVGERCPAHPDDALEERFIQDGGLEIPGCWTAVMRTKEGRSNPH